MSVHDVAATGFEAEADAYERARPSYPPDAVAWLGDALRIAPGSTVVDLAAGTGKFTRLLTGTGAQLVAIEPVDGMRALLRHTQPDVATLSAVAEALPLRGGSVDAIVVAQAFHWFDAERALAELQRVLRPGGRLGLIWNARDRSEPWVDAIWSIMDRVEKRAPWRAHDKFGASTEAIGSPRFTPVTAATFHHEHVVTRDEMVDRVRSVSHVAVLPPAAREAVLDEVREVLATDPATAGKTELAVPYRVDAYWAERLKPRR
ncbi:MAG TPA: class I SAM-dependent methyltransferase [Acidimicrobiia bacterium]|nr:class I SAM-dependent methyltransferase [Acidimicrobiia bacterium]